MKASLISVSIATSLQIFHTIAPISWPSATRQTIPTHLNAGSVSWSSRPLTFFVRADDFQRELVWWQQPLIPTLTPPTPTSWFVAQSSAVN